LLERPQQEKALTYGFRPASVDVAVGAPIDAAHGVDPAEPKTTLEVPSVDGIDAALKLFDQKKKNSDVVLVLDTSGSMQNDNKMENAKLGAHQFLSLLSDSDTFSFLPFSSTLHWALQDVSLKQSRDQASSGVDSVFAGGETALYDAIDAAYQHLVERRDPAKKIQAVVVLTDGADTESHVKIEELMSRVRFDGERRTIRIFTIAYGQDARKDILQQIAEATQAKSYAGTPQNIVSVFRDISTFF
jgi:Ca-activated chloride channel family protein